MANILLLSPELLGDLRSHLLDNGGEHVAFIFADAVTGDEGVVFKARGHVLCGPSDYEAHDGDHVALTDEAQQRIIKAAWDRQVALIELHSHPGFPGPTAFSSFDARGLAEFVPHVQWRLKGRPYAALVFGPTDFDGLAWRAQGAPPEPLGIEVSSQLMPPSGSTLARPGLVRLLQGGDA